MENIFRCGYSKIYIKEASIIGNGFINIEWRQSKENDNDLFTTICHITKIDLQKTLNPILGHVFEVNGIRVNISGYVKVLKLLTQK